MGHVAVGHRWDRVAMDLLDLSVTSAKGNQYVLVIVDCFSRLFLRCRTRPHCLWRMLSSNMLSAASGMPSVIHSDQGREFENKVMLELCLLFGAH